MTQALRAAVDALAPLGVRGVPVERIMTFYDVDEIDRAARDAEAGDAIKPVLRMS
jgi:hypothetical protein